MAFKAVNLIPGVGEIDYLAKPSQQFTHGGLIIRDVVNSYVKPAPVTGEETIEAIYTGATGTTGTGTVYIKAIPFQAVTFIEADCTNNTADNQLNKAHILTDSATVANTSTTITTTAAAFVALRAIGADSDKKLFGYLIKTSQIKL